MLIIINKVKVEENTYYTRNSELKALQSFMKHKNVLTKLHRFAIRNGFFAYAIYQKNCIKKKTIKRGQKNV